MAVTVSSFKARFPEFNNTDSDLVQSALDEALLQVNATVFDSKRDLGIQYLAAHILAVSPFGEPARLSDDSQSTIYYRRFQKLVNQVTVGLRNA